MAVYQLSEAIRELHAITGAGRLAGGRVSDAARTPAAAVPLVLRRRAARHLAGRLWNAGPGFPGTQDGPGEHRDVSHVPDAVPRVEPRSRGGNPQSYVVFGKRYYTPPHSRGFVERGIASWYGRKFHGNATSNGEIYDMYVMSAAHKQLPIPTYVEVTNLENGRRSGCASTTVDRFTRTASSTFRTPPPRASACWARAPHWSRSAPSIPRPADATDPRRRSPAPVAPPAAPVPQVAGHNPRIFLQAGAFSDSGNAERLRARLRAGPLEWRAGRSSHTRHRPRAPRTGWGPGLCRDRRRGQRADARPGITDPLVVTSTEQQHCVTARAVVDVKLAKRARALSGRGHGPGEPPWLAVVS